MPPAKISLAAWKSALQHCLEMDHNKLFVYRMLAGWTRNFPRALSGQIN